MRHLFCILTIIMLLTLPLSVGATDNNGASITIYNTSPDKMIALLWFYSPESTRWYNYLGAELKPDEKFKLIERYPTGTYSVYWEKMHCTKNCTIQEFFIIEPDVTHVLVGVDGISYDRNN